MTGLLDLTAELPVWAVAVAGLAAFLLGVGARQTVAAEAPGRDSCSNCRSAAAHHERLADRPAWLGWPGHHAGHLPYGYGDHLDPAWLEPTEKLPRWSAMPPSDDELAAWLADPQAQSWPPLTTGELRVEQALCEFEAAADTLVMEGAA